MWRPYEKLINALTGGRLERLSESTRLIQRVLEEQRWVRVGSTRGTYELTEADRKAVVKMAYRAWQTNPLAGAYCRLLRHFTFGGGIEKPVVQDVLDENGKSLGESAKIAAQDAVDRFWEDYQNQENFTGHQAQEQMSDKVQYEGELFITMFGDTEAALIRPVVFDGLDIDEVITDPYNRRMELYYKKRNIGRIYDFGERLWNLKGSYAEPDFYPSLAYDRWAEGIGNAGDEIQKSYLNRATERAKNARTYHLKVNCDLNATRGIPPFYRVLDWLNINKSIAEDMATYTRSLGTIAYEHRVKGGPASVQAMQEFWEPDTGSGGQHAKFPAGSTLVSNEAATLKAMNVSAGMANVFQTAIRRTLLMFCAGMGPMEHYLGDPSTGNLATANSMELPMVKMFQANQGLWGHTYYVVLRYQCQVSGVKGKVILDIPFPPIVPKEIASFVKALVEGSMNGLIHPKAASELSMITVGVKNVQDYLDEMYPQVKSKVEEVREGGRTVRDMRNLNSNLKAVVKELELKEVDSRT